MKNITYLLLLTIPPGVFCQQLDRLGLTCDEILAMSVEQFVQKYAEKHGNSEEAVTNSYVVYADCLKERNKLRLAALQAPDRERLLSYEPLYVAFREIALRIDMEYARGDASFEHKLKRGLVEDELLMQRLIALNTRPIADPTVAKMKYIQDLYGWVRRDIAERCVLTQEHRDKLTAQGVNWQNILALGSKGFRNFDKITPLLPRERQDECILVLEFYWKFVRLTPTRPAADIP